MKGAMIIGAAIVLTLLMPSTLVGWGTEGHEIVASLAQTRLTEGAKRGIRSLIGDASLASIANWADEVRPERDETYNWHFVDIPESASGFSDERDCFLPNNRHKGAATDHHNCVVDRMEIFKQVLSDSNALQDDRIEALKFLVHFVADVHQPFHAIGEAAGGNGIAVTEFGSTQCGRQQIYMRQGQTDSPSSPHVSEPLCIDEGLGDSVIQFSLGHEPHDEIVLPDIPANRRFKCAGLDLAILFACEMIEQHGQHRRVHYIVRIDDKRKTARRPIIFVDGQFTLVPLIRFHLASHMSSSTSRRSTCANSTARLSGTNLPHGVLIRSRDSCLTHGIRAICTALGTAASFSTPAWDQMNTSLIWRD